MNTTKFEIGQRVIGGNGEDRETGTVGQPTDTDMASPMASGDNVMVLWDSGASTWTPADDLETA